MSTERESTGNESFNVRDMRFYRYAQMAEGETTKEHGMTMAALNIYLDLVPVGVRGPDAKVSSELRVELFEERGHACEACRRDLSVTSYDVHHTDYTRGDNPDFLKILCKPCHGVINVLTGMKWWFAKEVGLIETTPLRSSLDPFEELKRTRPDVYEE